MKNSTIRRPISKRLRFEVFKRDGFVCKYCGRSPAAAPLHADHVIPVVAGGTNAPENLVTACDDCNLGKSAVPLGAIKLRAASVESLRKQKEHAQQISAFLKHEKAIQAAKDAVRDEVANFWEAQIGIISQEMYDRLGALVRTDPIAAIKEAIMITGARQDSLGEPYSYSVAIDQQRYFSAVMRNYRQHGRFGVWSA